MSKTNPALRHTVSAKVDDDTYVALLQAARRNRWTKGQALRYLLQDALASLPETGYVQEVLPMQYESKSE